MEWISVKDRLPEAYKNVLVYIVNASGDASYEVTFYCDHLYDTGDRWYLPVNITHWMPLPETITIQELRVLCAVLRMDDEAKARLCSTL